MYQVYPQVLFRTWVELAIKSGFESVCAPAKRSGTIPSDGL